MPGSSFAAIAIFRRLSSLLSPSLGHSRTRGGLLLLLAGAGGITSLAQPVAVPRGEAQLFVDDQLVAESHALQRTLRQLRKDGGGLLPVLAFPQSFGPQTALQASAIVYDPRLHLWVMFCQARFKSLNDTEDSWRSVMMVRYTSADGLNWRADDPEGLERVWPRTREDLYDPVSKAYSPQMDLGTVCFDGADPVWPYKAWFWFAGGRYLKDRKGIYYYRSRDGLVFERGAQIFSAEKRRIRVSGLEFRGPSDTTRFSFDPVTGRYLAMIKFYALPPDKLTGSIWRARSYLWLERMDEPLDLNRIKGILLVPEHRQANGDFPFDEYYDTSAYRYGSHWLGELKILHRKGNYAWSDAGACFLKLMSSADGITWRRVTFVNDSGYPEVFVPNGREGDNNARNDGGYMTSFNNAPLRVGDDLIFYYSCASYGKNPGPEKIGTGGGVFRARLRLDGFVSVDFGRLVTPLLRFAGNDLRVNSSGGVNVEALDETGAQLGAARLKDDGVRQLVRFDGKSLRELQGTRNGLKLRFTVESGAALYAFVID